MDDANTTQPNTDAESIDTPPAPTIMGPQPRQTPSTPGVDVASIASHETLPLGQPGTSRELDAATWAGQSLVVAVVLGGIALVAFAIKRRQIARMGGSGSLGVAQPRARARAIDEADHATEQQAPPRGFAYMGAADAMRDEIAALRSEIESTRDEASALRREVAALRAMIERGPLVRDERATSLREIGREQPREPLPRVAPIRHDAPFAPNHVEPKPEARESVEQRVLALAARGESIIAIAQRTGVPTGQVELMLNLARASGRA